MTAANSMAFIQAQQRLAARSLYGYLKRVLKMELHSVAGQARGLADVAAVSASLVQRGFSHSVPALQVDELDGSLALRCGHLVAIWDSPQQTSQPCLLLSANLDVQVTLANTPGSKGNPLLPQDSGTDMLLEFSVKRSCNAVKVGDDGSKGLGMLARLDYPQMSSLASIEVPADGQDPAPVLAVLRELLDSQAKSTAEAEWLEELTQLADVMVSAMEH